MLEKRLREVGWGKRLELLFFMKWLRSLSGSNPFLKKAFSRIHCSEPIIVGFRQASLFPRRRGLVSHEGHPKLTIEEIALFASAASAVFKKENHP